MWRQWVSSVYEERIFTDFQIFVEIEEFWWSEIRMIGRRRERLSRWSFMFCSFNVTFYFLYLAVNELARWLRVCGEYPVCEQALSHLGICSTLFNHNFVQPIQITYGMLYFFVRNKRHVVLWQHSSLFCSRF